MYALNHIYMYLDRLMVFVGEHFFIIQEGSVRVVSELEYSSPPDMAITIVHKTHQCTGGATPQLQRQHRPACGSDFGDLTRGSLFWGDESGLERAQAIHCFLSRIAN